MIAPTRRPGHDLRGRVERSICAPTRRAPSTRHRVPDHYRSTWTLARVRAAHRRAVLRHQRLFRTGNGGVLEDPQPDLTANAGTLANLDAVTAAHDAAWPRAA